MSKGCSEVPAVAAVVPAVAAVVPAVASILLMILLCSHLTPHVLALTGDVCCHVRARSGTRTRTVEQGERDGV